MQACGDRKEVWPCHLHAVRLVKIEIAQILQKYKREREKEDEDGVLFLQSRPESDFFASPTSKTVWLVATNILLKSDY